MHWTLIRCGIQVAIMGLPGLATVAGRAELAYCCEKNVSPKLLAEVRFEGTAACITVPVKVNGEFFRFTIDTGSELTIWDKSIAARLGRRTGRGSVLGALGTFDVAVYEVPRAEVSSPKMRTPTTVGAIDLTNFNASAETTVHGIFGMDFLKNYIVQFDFDDGRLRFLSSLPVDDIGPEIPLVANGDNSPWIELDLFTGNRQNFLIDTGSNSGICVPRDEFDAAVMAGRIQSITESTHMSISGQRAESSIGIAGSLRLGPFVDRGVSISSRERSRVANRLGLGCLSRYLVTLDFMNGRIFLKPGGRFGRLPLWDASGVTVRSEMGNIFVDKLVPFSPAIAAGLRLDDQIVEIDSTSMTDLKASHDARRIEVKLRRQSIERIIIIDLGNDCCSDPAASNCAAHESAPDRQKPNSARQ